MPKMIGLINEDASIVTKEFVEDGLSKKQNNITGAASTITSSNLTSNRALVSNGSGKVSASTVTATELSYVKGVTSAIQDQLNSKASTTLATTSDDGLMSSDDKSKLGGIAAGAEVNQNAFSNIIAGSTTIVADSKTDSFTIAAGTGISVTGDAANDKVTITNAGVLSVGPGAAQGTIAVNTDGTSKNVQVTGLKSAAFTESTAYDAAGTAQTKADAALAAAKEYTNEVKDDLLNGAGAAYDSLKELGDLIDENKDALAALEEIANDKANASDLTSHINNKSNPHGVSLSQLGVTATAAELNILDGATITTTELNYVDGVTSSIQTQLDGKAPSTHNQSAETITSGTLGTARLPIIPIAKGGTNATTAAGALVNFGLTATAAEINKLDGATATTTEINYLSGVSSSIQTQLNSKQPTITGAATTIIEDDLATSRALVSNTSGKVAVSAVTSTELGYLSGVTSKIQDQLNDKSGTGHTHQYAGSSSIGGAANSANKLNVDAGGEINPVYFLNGVPTPTTYTLGANVPSDAKFTDTTYSDATQTVHGLMSINDKKKLDGIASGANAYVHPTYTARTGVPTGNATPGFGETFQVSQPVSDSTGHITAINARTITIPSAVASSTANGLMSQADKNKLDAITASATEINYTAGVTSSIQDQLNAKVPSTRTINGQTLTSDITIEASLEAISNDEIDTICDQILGENLTQNQIDNLYNELINPTLTVEGVEF